MKMPGFYPEDEPVGGFAVGIVVKDLITGEDLSCHCVLIGITKTPCWLWFHWSW